MDRLCNIYVALRRLYNTACINMVRSRLGLCRSNYNIYKRHYNPVDIDKTAQAKVGAETWTVKSDKAPLLKGTKIKVLAIEGVKLIVEPVTE